MNIMDNKVKSSDLKPFIDNLGINNQALKVLSDSLCDNDNSVVIAIIDILGKESPESAIRFIEKLVEENDVSEQIIFKLFDIIERNIHILGISSQAYDNFFNAVRSIIYAHYNYNADLLICTANFLEKVFANGYFGIKTIITDLYNIIPNHSLNNKENKVHRELICVYTYNGHNFGELLGKLNKIRSECKQAKRKYLYGEIAYYKAVLGALAGKQMYDDKDRLCINYACNRGYELAYILKNHLN